VDRDYGVVVGVPFGDLVEHVRYRLSNEGLLGGHEGVALGFTARHERGVRSLFAFNLIPAGREREGYK